MASPILMPFCATRATPRNCSRVLIAAITCIQITQAASPRRMRFPWLYLAPTNLNGTAMGDIDIRIAGVCDAYKRAVYEKDVEAFVGLYHEEARVFDTAGDLRCQQ